MWEEKERKKEINKKEKGGKKGIRHQELNLCPFRPNLNYFLTVSGTIN